MRFTVVIPVYNGEKYIERAIGSVLAQTYEDVELIIVNDGSTDGTETKVRGIIDANPNKRIIYKRIENSGPSTARNCGIELASGDYICFLDSDDEYDRNLFSELASVIDGQDVCFFGWGEKREDEEEPFSRYSERFGFIDGTIDGVEAAKRKFRRDIWLCNCNEVYSLRLIRENNLRYPGGVYSGEDCNFIYKCLVNAGSVTSLDKDYFINIYREQSLMHASFSEKCLTEFAASEDLYRYALEKGLDGELCDMFFTLYYDSRIYVAKRLAKSLKWYNFIAFSRKCKRMIPKIKAERKPIASRKQRFENFIYKVSKPIFLMMCKSFYYFKERKSRARNGSNG